MAKVKRSQVQTFLNVIPASPCVLKSPTTGTDYALIGDGVVTGDIDYNPKNTEETYVAEDSATITVDSYAPTMKVEQTAMDGDAVFEFIDQLRLDRAILGEAETDIVNVWMYENGGTAAYPAENQKVSIAVDDIGNEGGVPIKLNYTINFVGTPVPGTFNSGTKVFTKT
jgi:hypothetical protein